MNRLETLQPAEIRTKYQNFGIGAEPLRDFEAGLNLDKKIIIRIVNEPLRDLGTGRNPNQTSEFRIANEPLRNFDSGRNHNQQSEF